MKYLRAVVKSWTVIGILLMVTLHSGAAQSLPIEIGSRLELLIDDFLIDTLSGDASFHLHKPVPQKVALVTDAP